MTDPAYDILLIGDYFYDLIYTGLDHLPVPGCELYSGGLDTVGGAMFITAAALARLGTRVGWAGSFGDDAYSRFVYDLALKEGLDMALARVFPHPYRRVTTSLALEGERAFITFTDPDAPDNLDYCLDCLGRCSFRHLHFGGLTPLEEARPLIIRARERGATVSMDCQDTPLLHQPSYPWAELLGLLDIFLPNAREARLLTGEEGMEAALRKLSACCPLVVVKDGPHGAWAISGGRILHEPAIPVDQVVDTTGAGDCFNAGFLFAHRVEQRSLAACLRCGNICGGLSVRAVGGATAAPTYAELRRVLSSLSP